MMNIFVIFYHKKNNGAVVLVISAQPLFSAKSYSQILKSLAVGVKYKYANPYIITQEFYLRNLGNRSCFRG